MIATLQPQANCTLPVVGAFNGDCPLRSGSLTTSPTAAFDPQAFTELVAARIATARETSGTCSFSKPVDFLVGAFRELAQSHGVTSYPTLTHELEHIGLARGTKLAVGDVQESCREKKIVSYRVPELFDFSTEFFRSLYQGCNQYFFKNYDKLTSDQGEFHVNSVKYDIEKTKAEPAVWARLVLGHLGLFAGDDANEHVDLVVGRLEQVLEFGKELFGVDVQRIFFTPQPAVASFIPASAVPIYHPGHEHTLHYLVSLSPTIVADGHIEVAGSVYHQLKTASSNLLTNEKLLGRLAEQDPMNAMIPHLVTALHDQIGNYLQVMENPLQVARRPMPQQYSLPLDGLTIFPTKHDLDPRAYHRASLDLFGPRLPFFLDYAVAPGK